MLYIDAEQTWEKVAAAMAAGTILMTSPSESCATALEEAMTKMWRWQ